MRFLIVSGMSGAGKITALKMLEDIGYFCVNNLPIELLRKFAEIAYDKKIEVENVAVGINIRSEEEGIHFNQALERLTKEGYPYEILFLDANNETLIKRYKETRRNHPLVREGRVETGIIKERELIGFVKKEAKYIIDTSELLTRELKVELDKIFLQNEPYSNFIITVLSFGFKYGIPAEADLVFDVRFLPNPYYDLNLRPLTGNDKPIQDFVMESKEATVFLDKLEDMLQFLIPNYIDEGKYSLVVAIGCTGGKHRSVTLTNEIYKRMQTLPYSVRCEHRDIEKDAITKAL